MISAMVHSADSNSDSDDDISNSPLPPSKPFTNPNTRKLKTNNKNKPSFKTKLLSPKNKNHLRRSFSMNSTSLSIISLPYPPITTPPLTDKIHFLLLNIIYILNLVTISLPVVSNYLHWSLLLIYKNPLLQKIPFLTTPLIIPQYTRYGYQSKFILLLHHQ